MVTTTATDPELLRLLQVALLGPILGEQLKSHVEGLDYYASWAPLSDNDLLLALIPTHDLSHASAQREKALILAAVALIAVLGLVGFFLARKISQPLSAITDAAGDLVRGDYHVRIGASSIRELDNLGVAVNHLVGELESRMTELGQNEAKLLHLANHDALTGLFNRRRFNEELALQIAQALRYGTQGALLYLDLDGFKYVNDSLGHRAGDELLCRTAVVLSREVRETDVLARLGGDEFAILLTRADTAEAQGLAVRLLQAIEQQRLSLKDQQARITASIGIALFPDHGITVEDILTCGDVAMYQAKDAGRNRVSIYMAGSTLTQPATRLNWEARIREALEKERFVLYAQLIRGLHPTKPHYELLLRMLGEDNEVIEPAAFLDVAERSGLILEIDRWVVGEAVRLLAAQERAGVDVYLGVNLSGKSLVDPNQLRFIEHEMSAMAVNPARLIFEVTETAAITDLAEARTFIQGLRALGCKVALDDFGVGFASFAYLKHLPVDYLKLDGSFIQNLAGDSLDQHLVKAMVQVARALGKETIAEFVSDEQSVQLLTTYVVDYVQGYYIGKPGPASEVIAAASAREKHQGLPSVPDAA